jgi:hypothetical protein
MSHDTPLDGLASRFAVSPREAGDEVFLRFARRLIGLARQQLHGAVLEKAGPEDGLRSVMMQPHEWPILERKLHGDSVAGIAKALQVNERRFYRALARVLEQPLAM